MFRIVNKTGFYLNARRVNIHIYKNELRGTPFYCTSCIYVSLLLAIRICKTYGVNLQKLAKKYYNREDKYMCYTDVKRRLKLVDKIIINDAEDDEVLLVITRK